MTMFKPHIRRWLFGSFGGCWMWGAFYTPGHTQPFFASTDLKVTFEEAAKVAGWRNGV